MVLQRMNSLLLFFKEIIIVDVLMRQMLHGSFDEVESDGDA
jgi:hypothetical protein